MKKTALAITLTAVVLLNGCGENGSTAPTEEDTLSGLRSSPGLESTSPITDASQLRGYLIVSEEKDYGAGKVWREMYFDCDGSFVDTTYITSSAATIKDTSYGSDIEVRTDGEHTVSWSGDDDADSIAMTTDNRIVVGNCWHSASSGDCPADSRIGKIFHGDCR